MPFQLPAWVLRHPRSVVAGLCLLVGSASGWLTTELPAPNMRASDQADWRVPSKDELTRYDAKRFQTLLRSQAWAQVRSGTGIRGARPGSHDEAGPWAFVGVITTPKPYALILPKGEQEAQQLEIGASLPDGAKVERIDKDAIEFSANGCSVRLPLYPVAARSTDAVCKSPVPADKPDANTGEKHD
jgi:hypothetical protein